MKNTTVNKIAVPKCYHCKRDAQWNTPALDPKGNLWCNRCVDDDRSGTVFTSVCQFIEDGKYVPTGGVVLNGVVVWEDRSTWTEGGSRAVKLTEEEQKLSPLEIAQLLDKEHNVDGLTRCTGCGVKMTKDQIAGYPLFAGVVCAPCNEKHLASLDAQRKSGQVCRMCRQPYGACCC